MDFSWSWPTFWAALGWSILLLVAVSILGSAIASMVRKIRAVPRYTVTLDVVSRSGDRGTIVAHTSDASKAHAMVTDWQTATGWAETKR